VVRDAPICGKVKLYSAWQELQVEAKGPACAATENRWFGQSVAQGTGEEVIVQRVVFGIIPVVRKCLASVVCHRIVSSLRSKGTHKTVHQSLVIIFQRGGFRVRNVLSLDSCLF